MTVESSTFGPVPMIPRSRFSSSARSDVQARGERLRERRTGEVALARVDELPALGDGDRRRAVSDIDDARRRRIRANQAPHKAQPFNLERLQREACLLADVLVLPDLLLRHGDEQYLIEARTLVIDVAPDALPVDRHLFDGQRHVLLHLEPHRLLELRGCHLWHRENGDERGEIRQ
jgi:hypothetical protein